MGRIRRNRPSTSDDESGVEMNEDSDDEVEEPTTSRNVRGTRKNRASSQIVQSKSKRIAKPSFSSQLPTSPEASTSQVLPVLGSNLTDYEKEIAAGKALPRLYRKYFVTQKSFKKTGIFLPEDKITPKQQDIVMRQVIDRVRQDTQLEVVQDGKQRYIVSLPRERKEELLAASRESQPMDTGDEDENETFPAPPEEASTILVIVLALIYFYRGKILEDDLILQLLRILPTLHHSYSSQSDSKSELSKLLQDFEHRAFIEKKLAKRDGENLPGIYMYWGFRAKREVDKTKLIPIYCKLSGRQERDMPQWLTSSLREDVNYFGDA